MTSVTLLLVAGLAACGGDPASDPDASPGQAAFGRYCAGCHGAQGQGRPPAFPPLAGSGWLASGPEGVTAIVLLGLRGEIEVAGRRYAGYMPPMQHLDNAIIADIVAYVQQRWNEPVPEWSAAEVARIRSELAGEGALEGRSGLDRVLGELP